MTHSEMLNTLLDAATKARTAQKHFEAATDQATKSRCLKEKKLKEKELDNVLFNLGQLVKVSEVSGRPVPPPSQRIKEGGDPRPLVR